MLPQLSPEVVGQEQQGPVGKEGIIIGGKKRRGNKSLTAWVKFVKKVAREEKLPYRDAMMRAKVRKDKGEKWMSGGNEIADGAADGAAYGTATGTATTANGDAGAATTANGATANGATANGKLSITEGGRRRRSRRNKSKRRGSKRRGSKRRR